MPGEVIRLPVEFTNTGSSDRRVLVTVELPSGSQWLGYNGGVDNVVKADQTINYQLTIKPDQSIKDVLSVRLPRLAGTHPIRLSILDTTDGSSKGVAVEEYEARYLVRDIDSRIELIQNRIDDWAS